ncbi:MAG: aliphatic sulfonate ABC transporter permease SsuC [Burkholderiaceae bacterium]
MAHRSVPAPPTPPPRPNTDAALAEPPVADSIVWQEPLSVFIDSPLTRGDTWRRWAGQAAKAFKALPSLLLPWLLPALLIVGWHFASTFGLLSTRILPAPLETLTTARDLALSGELWTHIHVSAGRAIAGLAIGGGLGLALGLLTGSFRFAQTLLDSTIQMIRNIPALALIPLVILWFGIDETSKLFLIAVTVFFPMYLNTFHGIKNVDPALIEMARAYGLSGWRLYRDVILPGALPSILVGLRFALGLMWVVLIVAETISAQAGIGYMTMNAREFLQTDVVLVGILLYALLGKIADVLARLLERVFLRWHPAYRA